MTRAGWDPAACGEAATDFSVLADHDPAPDGAVGDSRSVSDRGASEHASPDVESPKLSRRKDPRLAVEIPAPLRERPTAVECFERRAEEIARAAQVLEGASVEEPADLLAPGRQQRHPEVGRESGLPRRDQGKDPGRHRADSRVEERMGATCAEARDSVPFGLKRRVPIGISVLHDEEGGRAPGLAVAGQQGRDVRLDDRVRIDEEKIAVGEPAGGVSQGAGSAQDLRFREEAFRQALSRDKTRTQVFPISELGLLEMTRKRVSEGLVETFSTTCPHCNGRGFVIDDSMLE